MCLVFFIYFKTITINSLIVVQELCWCVLIILDALIFCILQAAILTCVSLLIFEAFSTTCVHVTLIYKWTEYLREKWNLCSSYAVNHTDLLYGWERVDSPPDAYQKPWDCPASWSSSWRSCSTGPCCHLSVHRHNKLFNFYPHGKNII